MENEPTAASSVPRALPERTSRWAQSVAPYAITRITPIGGGITNTKWLLESADGGPLVLRWADPLIWGEVGREHVRRESLACRVLTGSELPVPRLIATDPDGTSAGGPANLLTWRPGRVRLDRLSSGAITAWAGLAASVHREVVGVDQRPPVFTFRGATEPEVPGWARWPELWRQAIDLWAEGPPPTPYVLLHRDFHLGNTLWQGDAVTGVIDWAETSWGPPDLDVAHACCDFAMLHTIADAATFRAAYARLGGRLDPDPSAARFWLVSDILGFLPDPAHILAAVSSSRPDLTPTAVRQGLEDLLVDTLT